MKILKMQDTAVGKDVQRFKTLMPTWAILYNISIIWICISAYYYYSPYTIIWCVEQLPGGIKFSIYVYIQNPSYICEYRNRCKEPITCLIKRKWWINVWS